jgi:NAD(P)-dependent dehydrogenase (short-subunit alcohol dehydrogenase family)
MVTYKDILTANGQITNDNGPKVSIFAGGTSGIGKLTIRALVSTGISTRIYLIGRKSAKETSKAFIEELKTINPAAEVIWTEAEISLLADVKRVCEFIKSQETTVDLLFLSAGYAPFGGRNETSEELEITQVLEYYSRIAFIFHLLPLLEASDKAKVVSILAGGLIQKVDVDDLNLEKPGNFGGVKAQGQFAGMNTMTLDRLAEEHPKVTFIHSWPGAVNTGNVRRSADPNSLMGWVFWLIFEPIIWLVATRDEESGQRHLFQSTSAFYGGRGVPWGGEKGVNSREKREDGCFLVNNKCDCTFDVKAVAKLREDAQEKIWEKTQGVLRPYL